MAYITEAEALQTGLSVSFQDERWRKQENVTTATAATLITAPNSQSETVEEPAQPKDAEATTNAAIGDAKKSTPMNAETSANKTNQETEDENLGHLVSSRREETDDCDLRYPKRSLFSDNWSRASTNSSQRSEIRLLTQEAVIVRKRG